MMKNESVNKCFSRHISAIEWAVAGFFLFFLLAALIVQFFFGGGVLPLLLIVGFCFLLYCGLVFLPESYRIGKESLAVDRRFPFRRLEIGFTEILRIDVVGNFRTFKREFDSAEVILQYRPAGKKRIRTVACHPVHVLEFVRMLQTNCSCECLSMQQ